MKMKHLFTLIICLIPLSVFSEKDWAWWNILHGWETGMPSWRYFLIISPGYLGPNALPVPEVTKGIISDKKELEFGSDYHFMKGDNAQDISGRFYYPFAKGKIAVEISGIMVEHYSMSDKIRDKRIARDEDGHGIAAGDLYFTTMIQLFKNRKFPDTMLRMSCKTASGGRLDAARYSDSPAYFFDLSFSRMMRGGKILPYGMLGFYSWQTNDDMNLQDDAFLYGAGFDICSGKMTVSNSVSGYYGYKGNGDRPFVYTFGLQKKLKHNTIRLQYLHGIHDWMYRTVKISYIWNLD